MLRCSRGLGAALVLAAVCSCVPAQEAKVTLLRGGRVHVRPGQVLAAADVVVENGKIKSVGEHADAPDGATVIDVTGRDLWPSFIDPLNEGLLDPEQRGRGSFQASDRTLDAFDQFRATDNLAMLKGGVGVVGMGTWPAGIRGGVMSVLSVNDTAGDAQLIAADQIVVTEIGAQQGGGEEGAPEPSPMGRRPRGLRGLPFGGGQQVLASASLVTREAQVRAIDDLIEGGRRYQETWEKYEKDFEEYQKKLDEWEKGKGSSSKPASRPSTSDVPAPERPSGPQMPPDFRSWPREKRLQWMRENMNRGGGGGEAPRPTETASSPAADGRPKAPEKPRVEQAKAALVAVLKRERPLWVAAWWAQDIEAALDLAKSKNIRVVLMGCSEAWRVLDRVKASRATVLLRPIGSREADALDRIAERHDQAARLADAGVPVMFCSAGDGRLGSAGLPLAAALAIGRGMSEDAALAAVTVNPARALGLEKTLGSIEAGRRACLFVTRGSPFAPGVSAEAVLIDGRVVDLVEKK